MGRAGFKEWALVCAALGSGVQSVIIRKGGIAEGRDGFHFRHQEFFLFPTFFHEQVTRTRLTNPQLPEPRPNEIEIRYFARIEEARTVCDWETTQALEPLHVLQESVVRERFDYDDTPGVKVAFVRVFELEPRWCFPDLPRYGGCRSWVELPDPPQNLALAPVLTERENDQKLAPFRALVPNESA